MMPWVVICKLHGCQAAVHLGYVSCMCISVCLLTETMCQDTGKEGLFFISFKKKNGWLQSFLNIEWLNLEFSWFQYYRRCPRIGMIGSSRARRDWGIALSASILQMRKPSLDKTLNPFKFWQVVGAQSHVFWFSVHFSVIITCLLLTSSSSSS